ncbi:MAG TPA: rhodanese-like domain-containing protein [Bacteroidales bacterium]|nr:rhodanese-like domain-containing protein [Bacteroidales bacterium]
MKKHFGKKFNCTTGLMYISLVSLLVIQPAIGQEGSRSNLVSAEWLSKNLGNKDLVILDASPAQAFKAGHITGAVNYDLFSYGPRELPVPEVEKRYQSWGISPGKKIIIYDQGGTMLATRLLFSLDYYGFPGKNIYILDGGISKWKESGYEVTADVIQPAKGSFTINRLNNAVKADLPEFLDASGDPAKNSLVEALDPSWHYGELNVFGRRGHIPNAIMLPVADFYNPDKTFKSNEEIIKILNYRGIDPGKTVYTHCGGGIAASVPYFAIKYLLGRPDVKLFPGSQLEWAADPRELPFWTYDAPYLIRDAGWLQGWGGRMMRMYGISNVSFIDVRSKEAFSKGHIEYAVNLSPVDLEADFNSPGKMAELFSVAGVNDSAEAVIISGGGLTKEAALAFVALEKTGQKKISVFMDTEDTWEKSGFKIISVETGIDATKPVIEKTNSATGYPVNTRNGIIITDPASVKGIFPRIVIESGNGISSKIREGKIINLQYTDLLNSDGAPKPAKDIWSILSKAGVPEYAEIVCYSDDPGEAAIVYFTLRLMGFPDIKMLVD